MEIACNAFTAILYSHYSANATWQIKLQPFTDKSVTDRQFLLASSRLHVAQNNILYGYALNNGLKL